MKGWSFLRYFLIRATPYFGLVLFISGKNRGQLKGSFCMNYVERIARGVARALYWIAGAAIVAMVLLTCIDVVLRYLRTPIPGTYELVCFFGAVAVAFSMAQT